MKNIFFKTIFNKGAKGAKGDTGINYEVPTNSIVAYDGNTIPEGYVETGAPISGGGNPTKMQYLAYANCPFDDGSSETNKPLTLTTYEGYSDFLTYNQIDKQIEVIQDFEAILVPWVKCYQTGGSDPQMGVKLNDEWLVRQIFAANNVGAVGGINYTMVNYASSGSGTPFISNNNFNGIHLKLSQGDTIALQKYIDSGWSNFNLKIYKVCYTSPGVEAFFNSIYDLSNNSDYTEIELIGG